ncbi:embryonic protein DC-8-like [Solanum lycopersicum]|uniref:Uncharacterized protein n=1 Tax=Solanum lycopersicum TaxID=4081 RepID=A0A3Q7IVW5_SOLLC|nr:embryonic protein DC-8-like [Solanum lycopersicum]
MASRQETKKGRAEAGARKAADELHDVNKATSEKGSTVHEEPPFNQGHDQGSAGVIGGIFKSVKDTITGKAHDISDTTRESEDVAAQKIHGQNEGPKELYEETEDNARKRMQQLKLKEEGIYDEARQRAEADRETAAARGSAAKKNIYSAMGNLTGSIKEKLTMPSDTVEETRAARELGGPKRGMRTDVDEGSPVARSGFVFTTARDDTSS